MRRNVRGLVRFSYFIDEDETCVLLRFGIENGVADDLGTAGGQQFDHPGVDI